MRSLSRMVVYCAVGGAMLFASTASDATILSGLSGESAGVSAPPLVQQATHIPAGSRCIKWTRRWNTRHGFGHRRCVQWR